MTTPVGFAPFMAALNRTIMALDDPTLGLSSSHSFMEHLETALQVTKMGESDSERLTSQHMYDALLNLYHVHRPPPTRS